jgi:hypothetical protein
MTISEVALLDINTNGADIGPAYSVNFDMQNAMTTFEAGNFHFNDLVKNEELYLQFTSVVSSTEAGNNVSSANSSFNVDGTPSGILEDAVREITVHMVPGANGFPGGINLTLSADDPTSSGGMQSGLGAGSAVTLDVTNDTSDPVTLVSSITSAYTGEGATDGSKLTIGLERDASKDFTTYQAGVYNVDLIYTLSDN